MCTSKQAARIEPMNSQDGPDTWPVTPLWLRLRRLPEVAVGVVATAVVVVGVVTYCRDLNPPLLVHGIVALGAGTVGVILAGFSLIRRLRWCRWPALALVLAAPLIAALCGVDPIVSWNLAIWTSCLLVMDGTTVWVGALPVAVVNFLAVWLFDRAGLVDMTGLAAAAGAIAFAGVGAAVHTQRAYWREVGLRARELVAARGEAVAHGVAQERLRIARDLHDMIGHELAALSLQIGAAEVHLSSDPAAAGDDLAGARRHIQTVLAETQRVLTVLREPDEKVWVIADFSQLPALVEETRLAGLEVEASWPNSPPTLTPEASRAAYRIVQEALTNATKHGTGTVSLNVVIEDATLRITTVNLTGPPIEDAHQGYGLVGMRERAASVGGTVETRLDGNLFWLIATLPLLDGTPQ